MAALVIVDLTPTDKEKLGLYGSLSGGTLVPFGGEFLAKGPIESLHGGSEFQTKVVIQFPDRESAINWYNSDAYQEIIPVRNEGMDSQFHLIG